MNWFEHLPLEMYKHHLFLVQPRDIIHACIVNKHALSICDDRFFQEYIQRNFQPHMQSFILPPHLNWKNYLNILVNGITLPAKIINVDDSNISNVPLGLCVRVNVHIEDTLQDICENIKKIISDNYSNMELRNLSLTGTVGSKKLQLFVIPSVCASLQILEKSPNTIQPTRRVIAYDNKPMSTTHITKIYDNESFYLNLERVWVSIKNK
jgi:hypothetical protein